jgi:uncharacterized protein YndB with AHSA1/START domain
MIDYKAEVIVNAPAERVFRSLADASKYDTWTDMTGTRVVSGTTMDQVGAQVETVMGEGPMKQKMVFEVTEVEPNQRIVFKTISKGSIQWDSEFRLEPQGPSSTRVFSTGQLRLSGAARLMEGMMSGEIKKGEQKELEKFKMLLETNQF